MKTKSAGLLILLLVALIGVSNIFLIEEENSAQSLRCDMFQIYKETSGEYGWPPASNPSAAERCKESSNE